MTEKDWTDPDLSPEERAAALADHVAGLDSEQRSLRRERRANLMLYTGADPEGSMGSSDYLSLVSPENQTYMSDNIIQVVVDTATAVVARSRLRVRVQADGGTFSDHRLARQLDKLLLLQMVADNQWVHHQDAFRDGMLMNPGYVKIYVDGNRVRTARVMTDQVLVDERETYSGEPPRQIHQFRVIARAELRRRFPEAELLDDKARTGRLVRGMERFRDLPATLVPVVESWTIGPKGRHILSACGEILRDKPWPFPELPFVPIWWRRPTVGWHEGNLVRGLVGFQIELNALDEFIRQVQHTTVVPTVALARGSAVETDKLTNDLNRIIWYTDRPPVFHTPSGVPSEIFQRREDIRQAAFLFAGISELSSSGDAPAGLESGKALRELSHAQLRRFSWAQQMYERSYEDVARWRLRLSKWLYGDREVKPPFTAGDLVEIPWDEFDPESDRFAYQLLASSSVGNTPSGRQADVADLMAAGLLEPGEARELIAHADIQASEDQELAERRHAQWVVDEVMAGRVVPPEPYWNVAEHARAAKAALAHYETVRGTPASALDALRQLLLDLDALAKRMEEEAAADAAGSAEFAAGVPGDPGAGAPGLAPGPVPGPAGAGGPAGPAGPGAVPGGAGPAIG